MLSTHAFSCGGDDFADPSKVTRVTPQALHVALAAGTAAVVDARSVSSYEVVVP